MIIRHSYDGTMPNQILAFADGGLTELMTWMDTMPAKWTSGGPEDHNRDDFNGYCTWGDIVKFTRDGWAEGAERISSALLNPNFPQESARPHWTNDVAGAAPDIGAYLMGDPRHMRRRKTVKGHKPYVVLYIGMGVRANVTTQQFTNFGTAVCQLIDALEHNGTRVELNQLTRARHGSGHIVTGWRVKEADQPLDLASIAFTYMHPGAHRRLQFQMRARFISGTGGSTDVHIKDFPDAPENAIIFAGISEHASQCNTMSQARSFLQKRINVAAGEELITDDMLQHLN